MELIGADAALGAGDEPDGGKPLVKPDGRVLKNGADLDRKLLPGMPEPAAPYAAAGDEVDLLTTQVGQVTVPSGHRCAMR